MGECFDLTSHAVNGERNPHSLIHLTHTHTHTHTRMHTLTLYTLMHAHMHSPYTHTHACTGEEVMELHSLRQPAVKSISNSTYDYARVDTPPNVTKVTLSFTSKHLSIQLSCLYGGVWGLISFV